MPRRRSARRCLNRTLAKGSSGCNSAYMLWMESHEEGGIAPGKLLIVAALFLGAGAMGLGTAYAFLKKPLGLFERD